MSDIRQNGTLRVTILGSGSSGGVPRVGGDWGACDPAEPRNRRTRCSLLLQRWSGAPDEGEATTVLVDTSPDFREQCLIADIRRLDAILFTHMHADQTHGIDDVRPLAYMARRRIDCFMDAPTRAVLEPRFHYVFHGANGYPPILRIAGDLKPHEPVTIEGPGGPIVAVPLMQDHGAVASLGFRIGNFAYSNDVVDMPPMTLAALAHLDTWVVDALRYTPHPSHAHVDKSLGWAKMLAPRRTVLTNLHVDLDYAKLRGELPAGVEPAHDGWRCEFHGDGIAPIA